MSQVPLHRRGLTPHGLRESERGLLEERVLPDYTLLQKLSVGTLRRLIEIEVPAAKAMAEEVFPSWRQL